MAVTYAVVFKPFYYSSETEKQLARLSSKCKSGELYVGADTSRRPIARFRHGKRFDITEAAAVSSGYAEFPKGRLFWYNADYPLYFLESVAPGRDFYIMVEYDAAVNCDLDALVAAAAATETDLIAQRIETPPSLWRWSKSCGDAFDDADLDPRMLCFAVFSRRAVEALKQRRLELSAAWRRGDITEWPIAEGFVGSEIRRQGMCARDLDQFGKLSNYDVWPPVHAWQLPLLSGQAVVHPVLTGRRYWQALLRNGFMAAIRAQFGLLSDGNMAYRHIWTTRGGAGRQDRGAGPAPVGAGAGAGAGRGEQ